MGKKNPIKLKTTTTIKTKWKSKIWYAAPIQPKVSSMVRLIKNRSLTRVIKGEKRDKGCKIHEMRDERGT